MHPLGYAGPATGPRSIADNFVFRVIFAALGIVWNGFLAILHVRLFGARDIERVIEEPELTELERERNYRARERDYRERHVVTRGDITRDDEIVAHPRAGVLGLS